MSLKLVIEADVDFRVCRSCGDEIPDPYGFEEQAVCSTCDAAAALERRLQRLAEAHGGPKLPPPVCVCGKQLRDCDAGRCSLKAPDPQGELF